MKQPSRKVDSAKVGDSVKVGSVKVGSAKVDSTKYKRVLGIPLTPKGEVSFKQIDSLMKAGAGKAIGKPLNGKYPGQASDNIKQLLRPRQVTPKNK